MGSGWGEESGFDHEGNGEPLKTLGRGQAQSYLWVKSFLWLEWGEEIVYGREWNQRNQEVIAV